MGRALYIDRNLGVGLLSIRSSDVLQRGYYGAVSAYDSLVRVPHRLFLQPVLADALHVLLPQTRRPVGRRG